MEINGQTYKVIKNYKDAFKEEDFLSKFTDYFYDFDYLVGDIAYGVLRLKGFYKPTNKSVKNYNNYNNIDYYLTNFCANDCKYFVVEKLKKS